MGPADGTEFQAAACRTGTLQAVPQETHGTEGCTVARTGASQGMLNMHVRNNASPGTRQGDTQYVAAVSPGRPAPAAKADGSSFSARRASPSVRHTLAAKLRSRSTEVFIAPQG